MKTIGKVFVAGASALALAGAAWLAPAALGMGGEDVLNGRPWHHADMTLRTLAGDANAEAGAAPGMAQIFPGVGFTRGAALSVAWHADYIDSYLNNPLWWIRDPLSKRFKASISMFSHLGTMHHDDTFTTAGVQDNWDRYLSGALVGIYQAAMKGEDGDVPAAHHVLGVSAHAIQDFYSHSNWMNDPARRAVTWFETPAATRNSYALFTGAYELPASQAPAHHGAYSFSCSAINATGISGTMDTLCSGYSPFAGSSMCITHRGCRGGAPVTTGVLDATLTDVLYLSPKGIALDTVWQSKIGAAARGLTGPDGMYLPGKGSPHLYEGKCEAVINFGAGCSSPADGEICTNAGVARMCRTDSDYLFSETKALAGRSTEQFIRLVEQAIKDWEPGPNDRFERFWAAVKSQPTIEAQRTAQFEDFKQLGFQYSSAGAYPVLNPATAGHPFTPSSNGWYVRVRIRTATEILSGTDSDIRLRAEGDGWSTDYPLDYLPLLDASARVSSPLLVYNDFERGDDDVYTVGPFPGRPWRGSLVNISSTAGQAAEAWGADFTHWLDGAFTDIRRLGIGIVGGNADPVGDAVRNYTAEELNDRGRSGGIASDTLFLDGRDEGQYELRYSFRISDSSLTEQERAEGWHNYEFTLNQLHCRKESVLDRVSSEDEPLLFVSFAPLNGRSDTHVLGYRAQYGGVDTGETVALTGQRMFSFKLPPNGGVTLGMQQYESDDENDYDRDQLYQTFITGQEESVRRGNATFLSTLGAALAADWKVDEVEITPFLRGPRPEVAPRLLAPNVGWIVGGTAKTFDLSRDPARVLIAASRPGVSEWQAFLPVRDNSLLQNLPDVSIVQPRPELRDNPLMRGLPTPPITVLPQPTLRIPEGLPSPPIYAPGTGPTSGKPQPEKQDKTQLGKAQPVKPQ